LFSHHTTVTWHANMHTGSTQVVKINLNLNLTWVKTARWGSCRLGVSHGISVKNSVIFTDYTVLAEIFLGFRSSRLFFSASTVSTLTETFWVRAIDTALVFF